MQGFHCSGGKYVPPHLRSNSRSQNSDSLGDGASADSSHSRGGGQSKGEWYPMV